MMTETYFKNKIFWFIIFVCGFFIFSGSVSAVMLYADSSAGSDGGGNNCQSSGSPCKTFTYTYAQSVGGDTIDLTGTFDWVNGSGGSAETTSTTTGFTIAKNITIQGQSADQTYIQANSSSTSGTSRRVFTISAGYTVTMQDLTIRYGYTSDYGAGIYTASELTVDRCAISYNRSSSNSGGGIEAHDAHVTVQNSMVDHNYASSQGGGVHTDWYTNHLGTVDIINSTIAFNTAGYGGGTVGGGGICFRGSGGTITNSTIAYNDTGSDGPGVFYYPSLAGSTLTIENSVIAGNTYRGAAISSAGDIYATLGSSTITDNGNNILGYNASSSSHFTHANSSWVDAASGLLDGTFTRTTPSGSGSLYLDTIFQTNNSSLGTQTLAIVFGTSIAVDNGSALDNGSISVPSTDQRGVSRVSTTDIGAYEFDSSYQAEVPASQATSVSFSSVTSTSMTVSWTSGTGSKRAVFMKQDSSGTASPSDNTDYTANTTFGSGTQIDSSGWFCVYNGTGSSVAVSGLTPSTDYIAQVFEYNGIYSEVENYLATQSTGNPSSQSSHTPVTLYADSSTGSDSGGNNCQSSGSPCKTFTYTYAQSVGGDTIDLTGTFDWVNGSGGSVETTSTTSGFTLAKNITITGQGADQTYVQANSSSTSGTSRRVFTISAGYTVTMQDLTIRYGYTSGYGAGIYTQGELTVDRCAISYNVTSSNSGGGIDTRDAHLTVQNSTVDHNYASSQGGGIQTDYYDNHLATADIVNSTIAFNTAGYGGGTVGGGGLSFRGSGGTVTNSTIAYNDTGSDGAGVFFYPSLAGSTLTIENSIISGNTKSSAALSSSYNGDVYGLGSNGTITDNGNNIIGYNYTSNTKLTLGGTSWVDSTSGAMDGTFNRSSPAGSGSVYLDTSLASNSSQNGTTTFAITNISSIAIDNGSSSANGSISVPSTDQRGLSRDASPDIGAYEQQSSFTLTYTAGDHGSITGDSPQTVVVGEDGLAVTAVADTGYHFVNWSDSSIDNPRTDTSVSSNISVTANFAIDTYTLNYTVGDNGSISGSSPQTVDYGSDGTAVEAVPDSGYLFLSWSDSSIDNPRTDTNVTENISVIASFIVADSDVPVLSNIIDYASLAGAIITWDTNEDSSALVNYGLTSSCTLATSETDTSPRDTGHSVTISGLVSCTRYYYKAQSTDAYSNTGYSSVGTFKTSGCTGDATVTATGQDTATTAGGGSLSQGNLVLTIPTSFTDSVASAIFQANKLDNTSFVATAGAPSGLSQVGTDVYTLRALADETTSISTFVEPITVSLTYSSSDVENLDESSLWIYRYDGSDWYALDDCTVDTSAHVVSCTTQNFSDIAIFGQESQAIVTAPSSGSYIGGGTINTMQNLINQIKAKIAELQVQLVEMQKNDKFMYQFNRDLYLGTSGEDVRQLQIYLNNNGFELTGVGNGSKGNEVDFFGKLTKSALIKFQKANNIFPAYGFFGPITRSFISGAGI